MSLAALRWGCSRRWKRATRPRPSRTTTCPSSVPTLTTGATARERLLADMLRRCDEEGMPTYLESTSVENQALYHRHGFQVFDEMHWPKGGPPWWPMWREPRAT